MFSKQEAYQLKKEFWTAFGQYMKPVPAADGENVHWLNYRTGEKGVQFKMDASNKEAVIAIEMLQSDFTIRHLYYEQFEHFKGLFENLVGEQWEWAPDVTDEYGKTISSISKKLTGVSVFQKADWPKIISFFKPRIIALDELWSNVRYAFESLR